MGGKFYFFTKKNDFFGRFYAFYGQRTATWATRSPWSIRSYFSPRRNATNEKPEHDHMTNIQNYSQSEDSKKISDHSEDANKFRQSDPVLRDNSTTEEVPKN